jgi:DNA-binding response OmpR family regulator
VIFTTALSDTQDKLRGFKLGGVDYITRPFRHEEVLARINTHLSIRKLQNQLQAKNAQLVILDYEKNEFLGIVAHDLKSPLSSIQSATDFIKRSLHCLPREQVIEFLNMISITSVQSIQSASTFGQTVPGFCR